MTGFLAGCGGTPGRPTPPPPSAHITQVAITGLPTPLIFNVSPALRVGESYVLTAVVTYADGRTGFLTPNATTWTSSDPLVVAVEDGRVRPLQNGSASIALRTDGGLTATADVTAYVPGTVREALKGRAASELSDRARRSAAAEG